MRRRAGPRSSGGRLVLFLGVVMALIAYPVLADPWYEHYSNAEQALEEQEWTLAVQEINAALEKKGDSGARVRSYGMKVTSYFPYLKLGIAYYHLKQFDAALQAFETELRLGEVAQSESGTEELDRYRSLAQVARATAAAAEEKRIRQIVEQRLADARDLESRGLLDEAMTALDQALAVAPDDVEARRAMDQLRQRFAARERERELDIKASRLVEEGRALARERRFSEASGAFRQALFLRPSPETQGLLDDAQRNLLAELKARSGFGDARTSIEAGLVEVRTLESAGRLSDALNRLQSILAVQPGNQDARSLQGRLLQAQREADTEGDRQASIQRLLAEAGSKVDAGAAEEALSAANRVLALDPGNDAALNYVSQAYRVISQRLLGTGPRGKIPPAVRFVDLRREGDDGTPVQEVKSRDFRLTGVIIDNSPVDVVFNDEYGRVLEARWNAQPLGEFYVTEFNLQAELAPGRSTFRLVATDADGLVSSSEYAVIYIRPVFRAPWFYALLLGSGLALGGTILWRRLRRFEQLRRRRFNPYVAGAPVLDEAMFFGREALVDRILQTIHNNSLLIYGERRIGKTSIQHQLKRRLRELDDPHYEFHPVYVDLQGTPETRFFQTIAEDVFQELAPLLEGLTPQRDLSGNYSYRDFLHDIHAVLKTLERRATKKIKLVLLIDEVDELNDYDPRINQKLRSLFMKSFAENLVAVVSGVQIKKQWEKEGSPWYNFFEEVEVKPFGPKEARALIERPISGVFQLNEGVVERIISLTAGKPYLIQKTCVALVTRLHEQRRRRIRIEDVDAVAQPDGA